jgi:hypothetical protein
MPIHDKDTDPSTPGALRGLAATDPTPNPATHVSTDPGLGPSPHVSAAAAAVASAPVTPVSGFAPGMSGVPLKATQPLPPMPMGIVVPAAAPVKARKDSVELLLDGMQGPQPERPRMTPQTDGQSHAAYHAEHQVHPSRTTPDQEPKVVVERATLPATQKIDRSRVQAVVEEVDARRRAGEATAVLPQTIAPRVVVAIVAGLVVVLGLFVVIKLTAGRADPAKTPPVRAATTATATATATAATTAEPTATQMAVTTATTTETPTPSASTTPPPATPPVETATAKPPPAWAAAPGSARPKTAKPASTEAAGGLGEFKTTFH